MLEHRPTNSTRYGTPCAFGRMCCATCEFWTGERKIEGNSRPTRVIPQSGKANCQMGTSKTVGVSACVYRNPATRYKKWHLLP